jgi:hypothetical protein
MESAKKHAEFIKKEKKQFEEQLKSIQDDKANVLREAAAATEAAAAAAAATEAAAAAAAATEAAARKEAATLRNSNKKNKFCTIMGGSTRRPKPKSKSKSKSPKPKNRSRRRRKH